MYTKHNSEHHQYSDAQDKGSRGEGSVRDTKDMLCEAMLRLYGHGSLLLTKLEYLNVCMCMCMCVCIYIYK